MAEGPSRDGSREVVNLLLAALSEQQKSIPQSQPVQPNEKEAIKHKSQKTNEEELKVDGWPASLCDTELPRLAEMGLGKAVDATQQQQWEKKTTYQAKDVASMHDLVVITEGFHEKHFTDVIHSYYDLQASIGASVAIPNVPIQIGVAADAQRNFTSSRHIKGTTVITRTVAFKTTPSTHGHTDHDKSSTAKSLFEVDLENWLKRREKRCIDKSVKFDKVNECLSFLRVLGGVTHYISSITLGAMKYTTQTTLSTKTVTSGSANTGLQGAGSGKGGGRFTKGSSEKHERQETIGQLPQTGMIQPRSTAEAVIRFSITPLTNLVANDDLRELLESAIYEYISVNSYQRRGPFKILSSEPLHGGTEGDIHVYWKLERAPAEEYTKSVYRVTGTTNPMEASEFYIRPDITEEKGVKFYITTEDKGEEQKVGGSTTAAPVKPKEDGDSTTAAPVKPKEVGDSTTAAPVKPKQVSDKNPASAERYLHFDQFRRTHFLQARSTVDRKKSLFKLIDRVNHKKVPLKESSWQPTPDLMVAGEPYFIRPEFRPGYHFRRPVLAIKFCKDHHRSSSGIQYKYHIDLKRKSSESQRRSRSHLMLFVLINSKE